MRYFPLFVDLDKADVLVVGGGEEAARKVRLLIKTGARITVIAERLGPELDQRRRDGELLHIARRPTPADLDGQRLIYAATGDRELEAALFRAARARGIPINVVDTPELSTFITPAIVDRDPVVVAIGTEGAAPVLAREIKTRLESWLPANLGALARRALSLRNLVASRVPNAAARRRLWERLLGGAFRRAVLGGEADAARRILIAELAGANAPLVGRVALIGCGPGDPDLLTLKALQRLQEADVLVVDRLVDGRILDYARRDAERIFVGKTPGGPATVQAEINRTLVAAARAGKVVVRLKGGDPLIFGRAAEELAALAAAGIAVEIVPGITAAQACAARLRLPLTVRERVRQLSLVTGATADGTPDLDWGALTSPTAAAAIYMGIANAPLLRHNLLAAGVPGDTTVIIVENGTTAKERTVATSLSDLTHAIAELRIAGPAVLFVGLDWQAAQLEQPAGVELYRRRPLGQRPPITADITVRAETQP